jgi:formiminotetrahydrofolate cyclodeaminase
VSLQRLPVEGFVSELASDSPAPGGGSASAAVGAIGAALLEMVCNLTVGKEKYKAVEGELRARAGDLGRVRISLLGLTDRDSEAYASVSRALGLPKGSDPEKEVRRLALQAALRTATEVPLEVARACGGALDMAEGVAMRGNPNAVTDAACGARFLHAALMGALYNVEVNLKSIKDASYVSAKAAEVDALRGRAEVALAAALRQVDAKLGGGP